MTNNKRVRFAINGMSNNSLEQKITKLTAALLRKKIQSFKKPDSSLQCPQKLTSIIINEGTLSAVCAWILVYADLLAWERVYGEHDVRHTSTVDHALQSWHSPSEYQIRREAINAEWQCQPRLIVRKVVSHAVAAISVQTLRMRSLQTLLWCRPSSNSVLELIKCSH
jgi:hypothetical protein